MTHSPIPIETSLADRLSAYAQSLKDGQPEFAEVYDKMVERLIAAGTGANVLRAGDRMPGFRLPDDAGRLVSMDGLLDEGPLVISLNRGHWCTFCRIELESLAQLHAQVNKRGGNIIAVTPERQAYARKLKQQCQLPFAILSDIDNAYALSLGLVVWCDAEVRSMYKRLGYELSEFHGNDGWMVPIPATFVVGPDGTVLASFADADFRQRMDQDDILRLM